MWIIYTIYFIFILFNGRLHQCSSMDVSIAAFQRCSLSSSLSASWYLFFLLWLPACLFCFLRVRLCLLLRFIHTQNMLLSTCYSSGVCSSESVTLAVLPEWPAPTQGAVRVWVDCYLTLQQEKMENEKSLKTPKLMLKVVCFWRAKRAEILLAL